MTEDLVRQLTSVLGGARLSLRGHGKCRRQLQRRDSTSASLDLSLADVERFAAASPLADFYGPPTEVIAAEIARPEHGHFNVIHHDSSYKMDCDTVGRDPAQRWAVDAATEFGPAGHSIFSAPPEHVIVKKLEFHKEGHSYKHLENIKSILPAHQRSTG